MNSPITVAAPGVTAYLLDNSSHAVPIPVAADGNRARYIRLLVVGHAFVRCGGAQVEATVEGMILIDEAVILSVKTFTHLAAMRFLGPDVATVNIVPVEL